MADFVYNPAESIKQGFQQAGAGIGNIFTQVIAQQQRDYSLAENALNNAEALKKNLGIWGTKEIADGANNLLGQVSSAISKDGKLDYSKLGQVRQEISNLADLKTGYDTFGKQFDRLVQVGAANKESLTSFESFYKSLTGLVADKNLIANPNDLSKAMNNVLEDHLDTSKMGITAIKKNLPTINLAGKYVDPKTKTEVTYSAEVFDGVTIGADGRPIKPSDPVFYQGLADKIKASDPMAFDAQRRKLGKIGLSDTSDADIVKSWFDSMPAAAVKPVSVKDERQVRQETAQAKLSEFKSSDTMLRLEEKEARAKLRLTNAQINALNAKASAGTEAQSANPFEVFQTRFDIYNKGKVVGNTKATGVDLGSPITMIAPTSQGNKNLNIKQIFYDENGNARISYLEKVYDDETGKWTTSANPKYALIPNKNVTAFTKALRSNLRKEYSADEDFNAVWNNVSAAMSGAPMAEQPTESTATPASKPIKVGGKTWNFIQ